MSEGLAERAATFHNLPFGESGTETIALPAQGFADSRFV
jgi:hypothetical protein